MGRHRFLKEVCSFDGAFQVHSVEPGQDCKRALFIGQGDCTYMRAEDIEGSNLLDLLDLLDMLLSFAYWSLDVILSFFMPYGRDGVNISDCRMASLHYLQRSFILDLLI